MLCTTINDVNSYCNFIKRRHLIHFLTYHANKNQTGRKETYQKFIYKPFAADVHLRNVKAFYVIRAKYILMIILKNVVFARTKHLLAMQNGVNKTFINYTEYSFFPSKKRSFCWSVEVSCKCTRSILLHA